VASARQTRSSNTKELEKSGENIAAKWKEVKSTLQSSEGSDLAER